MNTGLRHGSALALAFAALIASSSSDLGCTITTPVTSSDSSCASVDPSTYDSSCSKDTDCALIDVGQLCSGGCWCNQTAAINVAGLMKYNAATKGMSPGGCSCGFPGTPTCVGGRCALCSGDECFGLDLGGQAWICDGGVEDARCD
jgi:hypothetical protein